MNQTWVRNYVEKYLEIHQCQFIERAPSHTTVKLSAEVDKDLTNRPYYWTFVERTGAEPETLTMTFIFDKEKLPQGVRGEELSLGAPRLKQFFNSVKIRGRIIRLFQQYHTKNSPYPKKLNAWLGANFKVEFLSYKKKDLIISLGINLSNGQMKNDFYQLLRKVNLGPVLPANTVIDSTFLTFREAALQLEEWILNEVCKEDFKWVHDANNRLKEELEQIETYYSYRNNKNFDNKNDEKINNNIFVEKEKRIDEIRWQYLPRIEVNPINYGIFYLDETTLKNVEYFN